MGAIEQSNAIYLSIADGRLSRRVKEPTDKSTTRQTKENKTVHEEFYKGWEGFITDIQVRTHQEYGKFWNVTFTDDEGDAILQMNYSSGYASAFLKQLPNVDFAHPVTVMPSMKMEGTKKKTSLFLQQFGSALKHAFTKENPNGLPQMRKVKIKGVEQWDDTDMMEFFENMVKNDILPKLKKAKAAPKEPAYNETLPAGIAAEEEAPF